MDLSVDGFLGGAVQIAQPRAGFRSGVDAVLLAASVPAKPGQSVLELGLGVGAASLCLARRVPGLDQAGLEIQPDYAEIADQNARDNQCEISVVVGDVCAMPPALRARTFDHVLMNPPYYRAGEWTGAEAADKSTALGETTALENWVDAGTRRLVHGGSFTIIQKAARLEDVIRAADQRLGSLEIKPIAPRVGRIGELVILRLRKGGRAATRIYPPLVMHDGPRHERDGADYSQAAENILRHGQILEF